MSTVLTHSSAREAGHRPRTRDTGMTLIEVLVGMGLFVMVGTLLLGLALSTSAVTQHTRERTGINEEARIALERMARELRQAAEIDDVVLPPDPTTPGVTSITFWTDFDGNGGRFPTADSDGNTPDAPDPEVLTYRWGPDNSRLTLTALDLGGETQPILAANVVSFTLELRSSYWEYDANGDGITTWQELDAHGPPVGNKNGLPDAGVELDYIDLIQITMKVEEGDGAQTYRTQIDLRNRN